MLLTAVIAILACGVAYTISQGRSTPAAIPAGADKPPVHEIVRDARVSANERIAWETNIGGTGDEEPVSVIEKNGEIYIFGNTTSSDLDFAGADEGKTRGFGARLTSTGRTVEFTVFDFTVAKVIPTLAGFAAAGNEGSVAGLYLLSDSLTVRGSVSMPALHSLHACALYEYDNSYFLVAESYDEILDVTTLLLHIYSADLRLMREKIFSHTYSLKLLDIMPYGSGYLLAAAATYQDLGLLTLMKFGTITEPVKTDVDLGYPYTPTAFIPFSGGFAAASDRNGNCELLLLDSRLVQTDVKFLTNVANGNCKTVFYANTTLCYDGEKLTELSDEGRIVGSVSYAPRQITDFGTNAVASFVAGVSEENLPIAMLGKQKIETISLSVTAPVRALIVSGADSLLVVADSHGKSSDCGGHFGGGDVWIARIKL